ncbi:MAG TPA: PLP-dependent aspartate aminotransferase family protein [Blastocatellia bacterium]|nr:PLP-dependent aspartate aminotransferase family protein [Blastocatellia bacterium]
MKRTPASIAIHGGEEEPHALRSVAAPIFQTSTFGFENFADIRAYAKGERRAYFYSRYGNPTSDAAAAKIAELESGEAGLVASSGSSAVYASLITLLKQGDEILSSETIYGGTIVIFKMLERFGIKTRLINPDHLEDAAQLITDRTKLFWFETPTNPTNKIVDISRVVDFAKRHNLVTIADNSMASPINQRPIEHGIDVVVHSATKYLGGHSDLTAGAIVGRKDYIDQARLALRGFGGMLDAQIAFLLLRGIKTLDVRMQRINANAQAIAERFSDHPKVERVYYPGLKDFPNHELAARQMSGFGGIISMDLKGGEPAVERFFDSLKLIKLATSFGGVETLITYPLYTTNASNTKEERDAIGVSDKTIRFAVGIESADDLIADIEQALK